MRVDLNADVGEGSSSARDADEPLLRVVTSANIACGFHAGDPTLIRRTVALVRACGAAAGAHPSLADREGFGRRPQAVDPAAIEDLTLYQVSALMGLARAEGVEISHVKPHGWLYHLASEDAPAAHAVARATAWCGRHLCLVGFAGSKLIDAGREEGLATLAEAFADRAYEASGRLVPRGRPEAVIVDPVRAVEQALRLVLDSRVKPIEGGAEIPISADTLCVHGDTPGAASLAQAVRSALEREGILVAAPDRQHRGPR